MIRKSLITAAATASLAVAAAVPLRMAEPPLVSDAVEAAYASVPDERRVPAPTVSPAVQKPAERRTEPQPSLKPEQRPQAPAEAPFSPAPAPSPGKAPAAPQRAAQPSPKPDKTLTRLPGYEVCNVDPQPCVDRGLTLYGQPYGVSILAAHNYMGYQWLSRLPVGWTVVVGSGPVAGTYKVTGHQGIDRQGGQLPRFGPADLILQTCEGSGTGFTLLKRVA